MADDGQAGFILVEMIVAVTILALGLGLLVSTIRSSIFFTEQAVAQQLATAEAQSMLEQLGHAQPVLDGASDGTFPSGQHWHMVIAPFGDQAQTQRLNGHTVSLEITWREGVWHKTQTFQTLLVTSAS